MSEQDEDIRIMYDNILKLMDLFVDLRNRVEDLEGMQNKKRHNK